MNKFQKISLSIACTALISTTAIADDFESGAELVVNDEINMVTKTDAPEHMSENLDTIYSGWRFRSNETQQMQMDDFDNPAFAFVENAMDRWTTVEGTKGHSCASCHGPIDEAMEGVRAEYPKWNEERGKVYTLPMAVNRCREEQMGAAPLKYTSQSMVELEALISTRSRGMPVNVKIDGPAKETWEKGKELYYQRTGQLELSCANCHEDNYGKMIRADHLSQGQINGFPTYRLKNAKLNSTHARFKGCVRDTRAQTYSPGSEEFIALELYVASRGNGLSVEAPSVRN